VDRLAPGGRSLDDGHVDAAAGREAKARLRSTLRAARRARPDTGRAAAAFALRDRVLALPALDLDLDRPGRPNPPSGGGTVRVAAYVSTPDEPGTGPLVDALIARGYEVLLPVLLPDFDLDWAFGTGADSYVPSPIAGRGTILEPPGTRLGAFAIGSADVVIVPALAVDAAGRRLGQGGGSYDRALLRVRAGVPVVALLFDDEILGDVAAEPHDCTVAYAITPLRGVSFDGSA
jgi:5-formyltetrahydrofolate cyclo-ligase